MQQVSRECDRLVADLICEGDPPAYFGSVRGDQWPAIQRELDGHGGHWLAAEITATGLVLGYLVVAARSPLLKWLADGPTKDGIRLAETDSTARLAVLWRDLLNETHGYRLLAVADEVTGATHLEVSAGRHCCRLLAGKAWAERLHAMMEAGVTGSDDVMA